MRWIGTGETDLTEETPLEAFVAGCNKSLFLEFRERCEYLERTGVEWHFECAHPGNTYSGKVQGTGERIVGYGVCAFTQCPIFERLKVEPIVTPPIHAQISLGPRLSQEHQLFEIFEEFLRRLEALKPIDA